MFLPLAGINNKTYRFYLEVNLRRILRPQICEFEVYTIFQFFFGYSSRVEICICAIQLQRNVEIIFSFSTQVVMRIVWNIPYQRGVVTKLVRILEVNIKSVSILQSLIRYHDESFSGSRVIIYDLHQNYRNVIQRLVNSTVLWIHVSISPSKFHYHIVLPSSTFVGITIHII